MVVRRGQTSHDIAGVWSPENLPVRVRAAAASFPLLFSKSNALSPEHSGEAVTVALRIAIIERLRRWISASYEVPVPSCVDDVPGEQARRPTIAEPGRSALHVLVDDGLLRLDAGRLVLARVEGEERVFALHELASVSIHGNAGVTSPALRALVKSGVPVIWRSASGFYAGQTCDLSPRTTETRRAHYAAQGDAARRLEIARAFVTPKIINTRGLLRRRDIDRSVLDRLGGLAEASGRAESIASLMGVEGAAAALAFEQWPALIGAAKGFGFAARSRRPPADPVNALLSYAYAVLAGECACACLAAGLDPNVGFLHAERAGRPALALDLLEPLRPLIAERAVLRIINRGEVSEADFEPSGDGGVRMSDVARRALLAALELRLGEAAPGAARRNYRTAIFEEAFSLARALRHGETWTCRLLRP